VRRENRPGAPPAPAQKDLFPIFTPEWVVKSLRPIVLPEDHVLALWRCLEAWAHTYKRPPIWRRNPKAEARGKEIAKALRVLAENLPAFIEDNNHSKNRVLFAGPPGEPNVLERLLSEVNRCDPAMKVYCEHAGKEE